MKNITKSFVWSISAIITIVGIFAVPAFAQASVNLNPTAEGLHLMQVGNFTQNPGTQNWQNSSLNVNPGDVIGVRLHYHNFTQGEVANNVTLAVDSISGSGKSFTLRAFIWADNSAVAYYTDSATINVSGTANQTLAYVPGSASNYSNLGAQISFPAGQSGDEVVEYSGVNVGNISYGTENSGWVKFYIRVSNNVQPPAGQAPTVTTLNPTGVHENYAYLEGSVNPNGASTDAWFEWGTSSGNLSNTTNYYSVGSGNSASNVERYISGLIGGTTYYYRAVAQNSHGTSYGSVVQFNTTGGGNAPTVTTNSANNISSSCATLRGSVDPNNSSTNYWFEYGTNSSFGNTTSSSNTGSGDSAVDVERTACNLNSNTTYYFRAVASNSFGTSYGSTLTFQTSGGGNGSAPYVTTRNATGVNSNSANLEGTVNPNGYSTDSWFEWGTSSSNLNNTTNHYTAGSGNSDINYNSYISGLNSNTNYYYRAVARNNYGTVYGATYTFYTSTGDNGCAPIVTTSSASFITSNSATMRGSIYTNYRSTDVWFEYGTSFGLGNRTSTETLSSSTNYNDVIRYLSSLSSNTTYYFRVVAQNSCGTAQGSILSFSTGTSGSAPLVTTLAASNITQTFAITNGDVNPNGASTNFWFEWGTNPSLYTYYTTSALNIGSSNSYRPVSSALSSLSSDTLYYYRVVASNTYGTTRGNILSFRTTGGYIPPTPGAVFSLTKETKNLSFPNGTEYVNAAFIGDTLEYTLKITNNGGSSATPTVRDTFSSYYDFVDANPSASVSGNTLSWTPTISAGETRTITFRVKARVVEQSVVISNTFSVQNGTTKTSNKNTTILNPSMMAMDMSASNNTVDRNGEFMYSIRYRNIGINDVENVTVKLTLPEEISFVSASGATYSQDGNVVVFRVGRVNKFQNGNIEVRSRVANNAVAGSSLTATAVMNFTDIFNDPQPEIASSATINAGTGIARLVSAIGFSINWGNFWVYFLITLLLLIIFAIVYLYYRISKILKY